MTRRINIVVFIVLAFIGTGSIQAQDELQPVALMFMGGMEKHEFSLISNSASRCGSLFSVVSQILARDTSDTEVAESLGELGDNLLLIAMMTNGALLKHRGKDVEFDELQQRSLQQLDVFTEIYVKRMTSNQASSGEMWGQDTLIKSDMEFCKRLKILFADEWSETLVTNDWSYWDKIFSE